MALGEGAPEGWGIREDFLEAVVFVLAGKTAGKEARIQFHLEMQKNLAKLPRAFSGCYLTSDTIF